MWLIKTLRHTTLSRLAEQLGRDDSQVKRWANGYYWEPGAEPRPFFAIELRTVDEVLTNYGRPDLLNEIYPFIEEVDYGLDGLESTSE
jgi:hypothetical protein